MNAGRQVVVVGGIRETEEVLKAVLEPRGWSVTRRRRLPSSANSQQPPRLVVVHADESDDPLAAVASDAWAEVPHVIVGTARLSDDAPGCSVLPQPFHYGELLKAIDGLLAESPPPGERRRAAA
ncbi:MAG: hypothetical protein ACE5KM_20390 [Planctomycetaceae bacterium]